MPKHLDKYQRQLADDAKVYDAYRQVLQKLVRLYQMDLIHIGDRDKLRPIREELELLMQNYKPKPPSFLESAGQDV